MLLALLEGPDLPFLLALPLCLATQAVQEVLDALEPLGGRACLGPLEPLEPLPAQAYLEDQDFPELQVRLGVRAGLEGLYNMILAWVIESLDKWVASCDRGRCNRTRLKRQD